MLHNNSLLIQTERRKKYTIRTERERNDNYIKIEVRSNSLRRTQLINCILILVVNIWINLHFYRIQHFLATYDLLARIGIFMTTCYILKNPCIESLTVFKNYGIQTTELSGFSILPDSINEYIGLKKNVFTPRDTIVDIIINEGFVRECQVIFYLAVIVKEKSKLKLLFSKNRIRLVDQRIVYNLTRNCLYLKREQLDTE